MVGYGKINTIRVCVSTLIVSNWVLFYRRKRGGSEFSRKENTMIMTTKEKCMAMINELPEHILLRVIGYIDAVKEHNNAEYLEMLRKSEE